jgi:hypothetical protein
MQLDVWFWGLHDTIEVSDNGKIDKAAKHAFMSGQCHSLALAIHRITQWPMMALVNGNDTVDCPSHIIVYSPEHDDYIDILGRGAVKRWKERYPEAQVAHVTPVDVSNFLHYHPANVEAATPFAETLLKELMNA